jgi:multidrug efflux pump
MRALINLAIDRSRVTLVTLAFLLIAGWVTYVGIPKEAEPDVRIPIMYVSLTQRGISPEDAERLLLRPMETQLKSITNVKEMRSAAFEGGGFVLLEFDAGFDSTKALQDVRAKVEDGKRDIPRNADEPKVQEVNLSLFPVLVVALGGDVPERTLVQLARVAKTAIEQTTGVLAAELKGARDEVLEIIVEPMQLKSYGVTLDDLIRAVSAGNSLVTAGALEGGSGRFAVKIPALIERPQDLLNFPIVASSGATVTLKDVAEVRPTFKDPITITRINGKPAITIEVSKRTGANIVETVDAVKKTVTMLQATWPANVSVSFTQDKSTGIRDMLGDLQNSVIAGVLLVLVVMMWTLGGRASLFVGLAIPASFLGGILVIAGLGLTINIVVLFTLILAIGELIDNAIVVVDDAERRMSAGVDPKTAYALAADRMTLPVLAGTTTRLVTFSPLLFWPGIVGEFMKYLPITFMATLLMSVIVALIFIPALGAVTAPKRVVLADDTLKDTSLYMRVVKVALKHSGKTLLATVVMLIAIQTIYVKYGNGVEFFPDVEPEYGLVNIRARGNISISEKDALVKIVEQRMMNMNELRTIYARAGEAQKGNAEIPEDTIGTIQFEFVDWRDRRTAQAIFDDIRLRTADIPGVMIEVTKPQAGPPTGKPIQIRLAALDPDNLPVAARLVAETLRGTPEIIDLDDGLPLPGIDWQLDVNRSDAARFGASPVTVGNAVQLVTNGLKITEYRPNSTDKSVDILLRYPQNRRSLNELDALFVNTPVGSVPAGNFVERTPVAKVSVINRADGQRVMTLTANIKAGVQTAEVQARVVEALKKQPLPLGITFQLKGEDEERDKASAFLGKAFATAIFSIFAVLLAQFNRFSSVLLIMSAVIFSTIGVLIGLLVTGQAFGVVMTGLGVISVAGIIVNNNILLIDIYDELRAQGMEAYEALLETCRQRARPVFLTAVTAVLGVSPIAFGINLDFLNQEITQGAPSTQWWVNLSTAIVFGVGFATILTLIVTPAALMAMANFKVWRERMLKRFGWRQNKNQNKILNYDQL